MRVTIYFDQGRDCDGEAYWVDGDIDGDQATLLTIVADRVLTADEIIDGDGVECAYVFTDHRQYQHWIQNIGLPRGTVERNIYNRTRRDIYA